MMPDLVTAMTDGNGFCVFQRMPSFCEIMYVPDETRLRFSLVIVFVWVNSPFWIGCEEMVLQTAAKTDSVAAESGWSKISAPAEKNENNRKKILQKKRFIFFFVPR